MKKANPSIGATNPFKNLVEGFKTLEKGARRFTEVANRLDEDDDKESAFELMKKRNAEQTGAIPKKRFEPAAEPLEASPDNSRNRKAQAAKKKRMENKARKQELAKRQATLQAQNQAGNLLSIYYIALI